MKRTPEMTAAGRKAVLDRSELAGAKSIKSDLDGVVNAILDAALATVPKQTGGFQYYEEAPEDGGKFRVIAFDETCVAMCVEQAWAERIVYILNNSSRRK